MDIAENAALVVVDVQQGFEDLDFWGRRNHPGADGNIAGLIDVWQASGRPVVFVRHDSVEPASPFVRDSRATGSRSTWNSGAEREAGAPSCW